MRPATSSAVRAVRTPTATPPPAIQTRAPAIFTGSNCAPCATDRSTAKATAAAPSFRRLSDSTSRLRRGSTLRSLKAATTATGSVAAIKAPNSAAPSQPQPIPTCMPTAMIAPEIATPGKANKRVTGRSARKGRHFRCKAASKISGGSRIV